MLMYCVTAMIKDPATDKKYELSEPKVRPSMYWLEALLIFVAWIIPVFVWLHWRYGPLLARSGSLLVFFSAAAEFRFLNSVNRKHLLNACRVRDGDELRGFSKLARWVGPVALLTALAGTVLWGFGDCIGRTMKCVP
jgi:hypothetical protein